jgi:hypothetical protein
MQAEIGGFGLSAPVDVLNAVDVAGIPHSGPALFDAANRSAQRDRITVDGDSDLLGMREPRIRAERFQNFGFDTDISGQGALLQLV